MAGNPTDERTRLFVLLAASTLAASLLLLVFHSHLLVAPRRVPILRAPSFPSLEDSIRAMGGGIDGLFGLSTLGAPRICIDGEASTITLGQ